MRSRFRLLDIISTGSLGLTARKARTALTTAGIAIGIAAMVAVVGISASQKAALLGFLDQLGTNFLVVSPGTGIAQAPELDPEAPAMIRRIGPVRSAAAVYEVDATVRRTEFIPAVQTGGITLLASDTELLAPLETRMHRGRFLTDGIDRLPAIVLGFRTATQLGIRDVVDRPAVHVSGTDFAVIGILEPIPLAPTLDRAALIGKPVATELFDAPLNPAEIYVRTAKGRLDDVRDVIPQTASPSSPSDVSASRPSAVIEAAEAAEVSLNQLLLGLGAVALLVGGVGIANVMVISVLERRAEIGVRRALGATRRHIATQFVVESALLSLLGGILGVALGAGITAVYADSQGWTLDVPMEWLAAGIGIALVIGIFAGLYPAARAARMDPAEAVRPAT